MSKKTALLNSETAAVITQAEAAANVPELTPIENQVIDQLFKPVLDAMDTKPTTSNADEKYKQALAALAEIEEAKTMKRNQAIIAKDISKTLDAQAKELEEQWLDAVKNIQKLYREIRQEIFNF